MRLLFLSNVFPSRYHPVKGTFNLELARALARTHELRVVCPIAWTDAWRGFVEGQHLKCIAGVPVEYPRYYYPPKLLRASYGWFLWQSLRGTFQRLLQSFAPEAILGYWAHPDGEVAVRLARRLGVPALVMVGGSDVLLLTRQRGRRRRIVNVLNSADAVVAVSKDLRSKVVELGITADKVHIVSRGLNTDRFSPGDRLQARRRLGLTLEDRAMLWVGRMVPVKGLDVLLRACTALRARGETFHLYLAGNGPLRASLEADARRRGLGEMVFFLGARPQDELPDWYRAADVTVLPSRSEGVPNVLRESLACGTPFVASRVGGIPEIAKPPNRLVPPDDATALAEALSTALATRKPLPPTPVAGWDQSAAALIQIVEELKERRACPALS